MKQWRSLGRVGPADIDKAIALHRAGKLAPARRIYEGILAVDANHVKALHFLGVLHHQSGDPDQAIASIERALALDPDYADAHNNLGNIFRETNQLEAAFFAYRRVVELSPGHADGWNNLGVMLRSRAQYDEAEKAYARANRVESGPRRGVAESRQPAGAFGSDRRGRCRISARPGTEAARHRRLRCSQQNALQWRQGR